MVTGAGSPGVRLEGRSGRQGLGRAHESAQRHCASATTPTLQQGSQARGGVLCGHEAFVDLRQ
jgi:hypothetical protein